MVDRVFNGRAVPPRTRRRQWLPVLPAQALFAAGGACQYELGHGEAKLAPTVTRRLLERIAEDPTQSPDDADQIRNLLSAREVDVLLLVARGLSNAEISAKLHLAETTVKSHVQSMLAKLGVRDRLQAAVAAYDSGLVRPGGGLHGR